MSLPASDLALIKDVQRKARQGDSGQWLRDYSRRFRAGLDGIYAEIRAGAVVDLKPEDGNISCAKGCTYCCQHFISIPVSHAVIITDYLYASEAAMSAFLRGYERWLSATQDNPDAVALLATLESFTTSAAEVLSPPQELLRDYHSLTVPCPFLEGKRCSIYPVRPICCAAYFALSPPEYCQAAAATPAAVLEVSPSQASLRRLSEFTDPRLSWHQEPLPSLVYKLLTRGLPEVAAEVERLFAAEPRSLDGTGLEQ